MGHVGGGQGETARAAGWKSLERWLAEAGPLVAGRAASAVAGIAVPVALARLLVPAQYGSYKQLFLIATTAAGLLQLGMHQSLYYFIPRDPAEARPFLAQATGYLTAVGALVALVLCCFGRPLAGLMHNPELVHTMLPTALFAGLLMAATPLEHGLVARGRIGAGGLAYVVSECSRVLVQVGAARIFGTVEALLWASAGFALARAVAAWLVNVSSVEGPLWDRALWRRQLGYCVPFGAAALVMIPQQSFHQYAVSALFGPVQFAIYSIGCLQLPIVDLLYTPVSDLLILRIGRADREGSPAAAAEGFREAVARLSLAFFPAAGLLFALAPPLIVFVFTARYAAAAPIFRLALMALPLAAFPVEGVLRAKARKHFFFWAQIGRLGATVALVLLGIKLLGLDGAILGHVAAQTALTTLLLWESAQALETPLRQLLPWRSLVASAIPSVIAAVCVCAVRDQLAVRLFPRLAAGAALFAVVWAIARWAIWATRPELHGGRAAQLGACGAAGGATQIRTGE